jgi:hypothetical protein
MGKLTAIRNLSVEHVTAATIDVDWDDVRSSAAAEDGYFYEAQRCPKCRKIVVCTDVGGDTEHWRADPDETECDGWIGLCEGPVMSYAYPCQWHDAEDAARLLVDLPLIPVVAPGGVHALALTGGGMDLSWEICAAYVALGFLPPLEHARDLPRMAGMYFDTGHKRTIAACLRSAQVSGAWARAASQRIRRLRADLAAPVAKPRKRTARKGGK